MKAKKNGARSARLLCAALMAAAAIQPAAAADAGTRQAKLHDSHNSQSAVVAAPATPNVWGTVAVPAGSGQFGQRWTHASADRPVSRALAELIAPARGLTREQQLGFVQNAVNQSIGWRSDATQWGQHDYWASPDQTLRSRLGDNEDLAIVKYHALKALGFNGSDLFLTIGRDAVRGPGHALLIARANGRFYALDDTGARAVPVSQRGGFQPMFSLTQGKAWIHGRPVNRGGTAIAAGTLRAVAARK